MGTQLRVLIIEDNPDDCALVVRELQQGGYEVAWGRVETRAEMQQALEAGPWDLIVSDFSLPQFSAPDALLFYRVRGLAMPFIIVSGTVGEVVAVESMRAGAHDFLSKQSLARLCPAVARELREAELRRAKREAEARGNEAEQRYRQVVDHMPALTYITRLDPQAVTLYVSPQIEEMTGFGPEEWIDGQGWTSQLHPEDRERVLAELSALDAGAQRFCLEYRVLRKDGRIVWWHDEARLLPIGADGRRLLHGFVQDITARHEAEQELQRQREALHQSEKLAAMGQLLAGVAHELNNPLSVVLGQASLLRRALGDRPEAGRAEKIEKAALTSARIVKNFLALARQMPPEHGRVALNGIVQEALELLAYPLRTDGIEVELDLARELPVLWADAHQLQQVLINLLTNAHHALRQARAPRRLAVTTRSDAERARIVLEVADSGPGIPPEIQARIFDPFFTTKPLGEGTGLGLPLCRGILERHGGSLTLESEVGRGALFRVELPVQASQPEASEPREATQRVAPRAPKSILLVDDEAQVRETVADVLQQAGHRVEAVASGTAALDRLGDGHYDLVLTDIRMPELDGPDFYREVQRRHPGMEKRFVFLTGDTLTPLTRKFLEQAGLPHLAKPFHVDEVRRVVTGALGKEP